MISIKDLDFIYPTAAQKTLDAIDLDIPAGSVTGIIGQSGSGKTTLVNILTGLLKASSGKIFIDDHDVTNQYMNCRNSSVMYRSIFS
jgi:ABC-type bacteriocin/lantibiotic exporter with double-glycine peptidase domain